MRGISPSLKAGESLAPGTSQHRSAVVDRKSEVFPARSQGCTVGDLPSSSCWLSSFPPAARRQLRVAMETGCPPTRGCQLRFPAELRSRRLRGHPGVEMGLPGDIRPPANHAVWLGIQGPPGDAGLGKPPNLSTAPRDWSLEHSGELGPLLSLHLELQGPRSEPASATQDESASEPLGALMPGRTAPPPALDPKEHRAAHPTFAPRIRSVCPSSTS